MTFDRATLDRLYQYGYGLTGDRDHAFSLVQEALANYLEADRERTIHHPMAYLRTTMRNRLIDAHRRAQRFPEVGLQALDQLETAGSGLEETRIAQADLRQLWSVLAPLERETLYLWAVEGYTAREIGEMTDSSRNTILSRLHRSKLKLREAQSNERGLA